MERNYRSSQLADSENYMYFRNTLIAPETKNMTAEATPREGTMLKTETECTKICQIIQNVHPFRYHTAEELMEIIIYMYSIKAQIGDIICYMNEEKDSFYVITSGEFVKKSINQANGSVKVKIHKEKGYFGISALTDGSNAEYEVMARTQGNLFALSAARFHWLKKKAAQKTTQLIKHIISFKDLFPTIMRQLDENQKMEAFKLCDLEEGRGTDIEIDYQADSNQQFSIIYILVGEAKIMPKVTETGRRAIKTESEISAEMSAMTLYSLKANDCIDLQKLKEKLDIGLEENAVTFLAVERCIFFRILGRYKI